MLSLRGLRDSWSPPRIPWGVVCVLVEAQWQVGSKAPLSLLSSLLPLLPSLSPLWLSLVHLVGLGYEKTPMCYENTCWLRARPRCVRQALLPVCFPVSLTFLLALCRLSSRIVPWWLLLFLIPKFDYIPFTQSGLGLVIRYAFGSLDVSPGPVGGRAISGLVMITGRAPVLQWWSRSVRPSPGPILTSLFRGWNSSMHFLHVPASRWVLLCWSSRSHK